MNKWITVDAVVKRLTEMAESYEDAEPEVARGIYSSIWQIQNNVPVIEEKLISKTDLLKDISEAIKEFIPKDETDQAFLEGCVATRRIVRFAREVKA